MIQSIEIAPTGKTKCYHCFKEIPKGTPRGYEIFRGYNGQEASHWYCVDCIPKKLNFDVATAIEKKEENELKLKRLLEDTKVSNELIFWRLKDGNTKKD